MANQIINILPTDSNLLGLFLEDSIMALCDTAVGAFSTTMPDGFLSKCHTVKFFNIGSNDFTINFQARSLLYFNAEYVANIVVGSGESFEAFNEPITGKWRAVTDPSVRLIWEDDRLKGQVYQDGAWHTCIKGGY